MPTDMGEILDLVQRECDRQHRKWGVQSHGELKWLAILMEEVGEAAMDCNELEPALGKVGEGVEQQLRERLRTELIQCAAVCVSWLDCMNRKEDASHE